MPYFIEKVNGKYQVSSDLDIFFSKGTTLKKHKVKFVIRLYTNK